MRVVGQIGGACYAVHVEGNYAYIGEGWNLTILDVSTPTTPIAVGKVLLPDIVHGVFVFGNLAYVADWDSGLQIIDVSNPASPQLRGAYNTPGYAYGVFVSGALAYVADGYYGGLRIIDVSNPASPQLRGWYDTPDEAMGVFVFGNLAYVADWDSGLQIIDVSNPASPQLRASYNTPGEAMGVYVSGNLAYVADYWRGLQIIDVSNPTSPTLAGSYDTPDEAHAVSVSGGLAYVTDYWMGLQIIDVSNPTSPTLGGSYDTPDRAYGVSVSGGLAYVADWSSGLQIIDVANPSSPTLRGSYDTPGYAHDVCVSGGLAYVADHGSGLRIIDVSNPTWPAPRGSYDTPGYAYGVSVSGGIAYVADREGGLQIIDVSNPSSPQLRGSYDTPDRAYGVFVSAGLAHVADWRSGLQIIDVSNPSSPQLRGSYDMPGYAYGVSVSGTLAYVADTSTGLQIVDISNPSSPTLRGSYDMPAAAFGVSVSGGLAYVADAWGGLQIIDVSNPSSPTLRGSCYTPGGARGVSVSGGLAYVADWTSGLQIIDVSNPTSPTLRGSYDTPSYAYGASVSGGLAYVADGDSGLWILQFTGEAPRVQGATVCDHDADGVIEVGEQLVLTLDRSVVVTTAALGASHFFLPVAGDTLGGAGFAVGVTPLNWRQIVLTLGDGVHLTAAGQFTTGSLTVGAPSGIDFAASLPFGAIMSLTGISAIDGGAAGVNDSGIDVQLNAVGQTTALGPAGGVVTVAESPDAAYTGHGLSVPTGALAAPTTFTLRPPVDNLGVVNAVQIVSSDLSRKSLERRRPGGTFLPVVNPRYRRAAGAPPLSPTFPTTAPATLWVQYREGDIDWERGQIEAEMRLHRLVERAPSGVAYRVIDGPQTLHAAARRVSVPLLSLQPPTVEQATGPAVTEQLSERNAFGGIPIEGLPSIFACLSIMPVEEWTIHIKPQAGLRRAEEALASAEPSAQPGSASQAGAGGVITPQQDDAVLTPGPGSAYPLHRIEFPGYVETATTDPLRLIVTMRTATLAEREALSGGRSFPAQSGAVFVVTVRDAASSPVAFSDPVHITVQFKARSEPALSDCVTFGGAASAPRDMRVVRDGEPGAPVNFGFIAQLPQVVSIAQGTVRVENVAGLTGSDGLGTWGSVGSAALPLLGVARWGLYR